MEKLTHVLRTIRPPSCALGKIGTITCGRNSNYLYPSVTHGIVFNIVLCDLIITIPVAVMELENLLPYVDLVCSASSAVLAFDLSKAIDTRKAAKG